MAALDHPWNDIVAPVTDGTSRVPEDLCRCEHRRPLPADQGEDSRPQLPSDTVQRNRGRVPLEGGEISRPHAATCVPDIHDRHHRSVTDQDIAGVRSAWTMSGASRGGGTSTHTSRRRSTKADTTEEYPESGEAEPGDSRFLTGGDPPGVGPVVVRLGG